MSDDNKAISKAQQKGRSVNKASQPPINASAVLAVALPWTLDFITPSLFLTTFLGASLWYLLIASSFLHLRAKDKNLKRNLNWLSKALWPLWLIGLSFNLGSQNFPLESWTAASLSTWIIRIHATLLAGASGLVFLIAMASIAWLVQMRRVRAPSWNRRQKVRLPLPSLESLNYVIQRASMWAFVGWGIGLALAFVSLKKTQYANFFDLLSSDFQILSSVILWAVLLVLWLFTRYKVIRGQIRRTGLILTSAALFWALLVFQAFLRYNVESFHEPLRWWTR